ncbi:MAG: cupin protein [Conexibacter sp.]|jgi:uncharacterized cupin superfamily protein|nr:cupin protein [Conexibacter sp.]
MPNIYDPVFDEPRTSLEGFHANRARLGHQLVNDTDETLRLLSVSTHGQPDVVIYPDEGKLCAAERTPDGSGLKTFFRLADHVPYDEGIQRPEIGHVDPA